MDDIELRTGMIEICRRMCAEGLAPGRSGNLSCRVASGFLVTPSALEYERMGPADLVEMDLDGRVLSGRLRPSSEWRIHRDLLRARPRAGSVLHCHAPHATSLACLGLDIPAFHYMVAVAGGDTIPCAPYATFGTQALSDHVLRTMGSCNACLMANHGMVAVAADAAGALALAREVETLAGQYWRTLAAGRPVLLSGEEMDRVRARFDEYRSQPPGDDDAVL